MFANIRRIIPVMIFALSLLVLTANAYAAEDKGPKEIAFEQGKALPPPSEGMAWCLVTIPAKFKTVEEKVEISPETYYMETVPAVYETKTEKIMVAPEKKRAVFVPAKWKTETIKQLVAEESFEYRITPAKYECVDETVAVQDAYDKPTYLPAVYKTVRDNIEVAPAHTEYRKAKCKAAAREGKNVQCYAAVDVPAKFRGVCREEMTMTDKVTKEAVPERKITVKVRKMVEPPKAEKVVIPARYKEITKHVLVTPAKYEFETIPAKYETISKLVLAKAASTKKVTIPAKFTTMTRQELVSPERMVWRECSAAKCGIVSVMKKYGSVPGAPAATE